MLKVSSNQLQVFNEIKRKLKQAAKDRTLTLCNDIIALSNYSIANQKPSFGTWKPLAETTLLHYFSHGGSPPKKILIGLNNSLINGAKITQSIDGAYRITYDSDYSGYHQFGAKSAKTPRRQFIPVDENTGNFSPSLKRIIKTYLWEI